ncbi:hypothetical protein EVJ50_10445 [Synechococcus sp. RSCCF101]|nr:HpsJ family protein [Synechococcus sp. RSCCF101]QEY33483.1 hypothetical protein EVJ50_10445 [Synechococcus sp. RSCCF101]
MAVLLRWLGLTLVLLLLLQLAVLLPAADWGDEAFQQLLLERMVSQAPMALVGLILMLTASRLDAPQSGRTPFRWLICALSALLALSMLAVVPLVVSGNQSLAEQADQTISEQRNRLEAARQQSGNPEAIQMLGQQLAQAGQLPAGAGEEEQVAAARAFVDRQLEQMETQLEQAERARSLAVNQRRFGGTGTAIVLAIAFVLLALTAVV